MGVRRAMTASSRGVGIHPFGRFDDLTNTDMGVHAVRAALAEAGEPDVPGAFCGTAYGGVASGHKVLGALARTGMPIVDVEAGCASGGAALQLAAGAIRGRAVRLRARVRRREDAEGHHPLVVLRTVARGSRARRDAGVLRVAGAAAAARARASPRTDLAAVVVKNRRHGVDNPDAMFRKEVTADEVLASRVVCEPLHLWMLCSPNEGAAAVVLRRAGGDRPGVTLASARLRSHLPGSVLGEATPLSGIDDTDIIPPSTLAARDAYDEAGIGPDDVDVVECQDTDAARELLAYHELGLCAPGEQASLLADGTVRLGGARPVNPSGGLLSKGEPLGASALGQVVELVHQLRGEAGSRQVDGARVGLAHTVGRGANACCIVLEH